MNDEADTNHLVTSDKTKNDRGKRRLQIASVVCLIFVIAEFVAGIFAKSIAVQADAAHMLTDLMSFGVSLVALRISDMKATKSFTFGYVRAEVLGALMSIVILWIITGILVYSAILRFIDHEEDINPDIMIGISVAAIFFNLVLGFILIGSGHGHSHGVPGSHSHGHSHDGGHGHSHGCFGGSGEAMNIKAAVIHIIGDLVQSIGVLIAGIIIKFANHESAHLADPICTLIFLIIILFTTIRVVLDIIKILMGHVDSHDYDRIVKILEDHVDGTHSLHIWTIVPGELAISGHIKLRKSLYKSDDEQLILLEEQLRKVQPNLKCLTLQTKCSCVAETYCHTIKECSSSNVVI